MAKSSTFDSNAFLDTVFDGGMDTSVILPDPGDYPAQITDKIELNTGIIGEGKMRAGEPWANLSIQWELLDENVKKNLNMERVFARQSIMIDLLPGSTPDRPMIDLGTNKSMRLKKLADVTGLNKNKKWRPSELKFQTATVHIEHRRPDGFDDDVAEVTRVSPFNGHG